MWISRALRPHCRLTLRRGAIRFNRNMTHNVTVQKIGAAAPPGAAASRQVPMPPRQASPDAWRRPAAQVSRLDSDAASHRMRARKPMTMPRVVCPSPVSSVDGNQSIGTLTHAGCRNTVVFSSASGSGNQRVRGDGRMALYPAQVAVRTGRLRFRGRRHRRAAGHRKRAGMRFQTVDIPLGKTEGAALNGELPQWERVGCSPVNLGTVRILSHGRSLPVLEALAQANDVVVVDIGAPSALHSLPMLRQCRQVVLAELTVLGLARARAARAMMIRQGSRARLWSVSCPADCRAAAAWSTRTRHRSICMRSWPGWWLRSRAAWRCAGGAGHPGYRQEQPQGGGCSRRCHRDGVGR